MSQHHNLPEVSSRIQQEQSHDYSSIHPSSSSLPPFDLHPQTHRGT
ncbi:hypothetical protein GBAR_LOCUS9039 [Geodia barretti]|uniref:Uncharacterized protein n=1 Tax=Geodia barretti TaxID=519541 RepID=A0AA35WBK3_GEOBA|nr:hypothetical protein GBAR_LOCUS9039 [Geodia barretti]